MVATLILLTGEMIIRDMSNKLTTEYQVTKKEDINGALVMLCACWKSLFIHGWLRCCFCRRREEESRKRGESGSLNIRIFLSPISVPNLGRHFLSSPVFHCGTTFVFGRKANRDLTHPVLHNLLLPWLFYMEIRQQQTTRYVTLTSKTKQTSILQR
jgi:hypothetical protein